MLNTDHRRRRLALGAGIGSLVLAVSACANSGSSSAPAATSSAVESAAASASESTAASTGEGPSITITGITSFGADEVTVPAGQTLTVTNSASFPHTFTEGTNGVPADPARVNEQVPVGQTVQVSFPEPGDYHVTCTFHPAMNMVVHVE